MGTVQTHNTHYSLTKNATPVSGSTRFTQPPPAGFPAVGSAVLNALTKTLETKAYAITDVSLCAPFLAFDPVMQFLLPVRTQRPVSRRRRASSPSAEVVGVFFLDFEPFRTASVMSSRRGGERARGRRDGVAPTPSSRPHESLRVA